MGILPTLQSISFDLSYGNLVVNRDAVDAQCLIPDILFTYVLDKAYLSCGCRGKNKNITSTIACELMLEPLPKSALTVRRI